METEEEEEEEVYANVEPVCVERGEGGARAPKRDRTGVLGPARYQVLHRGPRTTAADDLTLPPGADRKSDRKSDGSQCGRSRLAVLCLGLLCAALLSTVIGLSVRHDEAYYQLTRDLSKRASENQQLQTSLNNLTAERDQLRGERDQLEARYDLLTRERDQLVTTQLTLRQEKDQMQRKVSELERSVRPCCDGWRRFSCSCYYVSTEKKTWEESRQDCIRRGAHLVIINNREEQEFLNTVEGTDQPFWIGLSDSEQEGSWRWVDGTTAETTFWRRGEPNNAHGEEDCAVYNGQRGGVPAPSWNDITCRASSLWVCETALYCKQ